MQQGGYQYGGGGGGGASYPHPQYGYPPPNDPYYYQHHPGGAHSQYPPPPPPSGYPHYAPPPPQRAYPPPPQDEEFYVPPAVAHDPNEFRRFFMHHLGKLTFNSKPVITNLTLFAHQHLLKMAPIVASCLEDHLRNCQPNQRLPALYLLDSISKNIGPPYIVLFTRFIERIFLTSYHAVDDSTKVKLEELLGTWRTGGADGGELFRMPEEGRVGRVQRGIETVLFGSAGRGGGIAGGRAVHQSEQYNNGVQQLPAAATPGERSGVLFDVRRLLDLRKNQATVQPDDKVNLSQIAALQKLESLVLDTQLTSDQVYQIRGQLAALAPAPVPTPAPTPAPSVSQPPPPSLPTSAPLTQSTSNGGNGSGGALQGIDLNLLAQLKGLTGDGTLSGILSGSGTPLGAAGQVKQEGNEENVKIEEVDDAEDTMRTEYDDDVIKAEVLLTTADILKPRPEAVSFVYSRLALQCNQCGLRFIDSKPGKKEMDAHLDWHFTHKRRIREGAGRPQGRSWLSSEDDWIHSDDVDVLYDSADQVAAPSKEAAAKVDRAILLARKVVAPTDPQELEKAICPICKERFKSEWNDEEEEWVFFNAELVDGVIYMATCRAEAAASRIASHLRVNESAAVSREGTPMDDGGGGGQRKRKAVEDGSDGETKKPKSEADL